MRKRITATGRPVRRIEVTGKAQRRIEDKEVATALGAEPVGEAQAPKLGPITLAALGSELIKRLRSTGGRPALNDATEICRVPLSAEDLKALENVTAQIARTSGTRPSPGQVVSTIVRACLRSECATSRPSVGAAGSPPWPEGWNGKREKCRAAQKLIEVARSTWGTKEAA